MRVTAERARELAPDHARFCITHGLADLALGMRPDGVFAMWSDDPAESGFIAQPRALDVGRLRRRAFRFKEAPAQLGFLCCVAHHPFAVPVARRFSPCL